MTTTPVVWLTHKLVGEFIERANNRYEQVNGAGPGWSAANWTGELVLETYTQGCWVRKSRSLAMTHAHASV